MTERTGDTVLKRMADAGRGAGGRALTPERALGIAFAKAGQDMMKLPLVAASAAAGRMSLAEITETLPERALIALLDGPGEGIGLLALAPEMLASLIEMQTTGRVAGTQVAPRRPTRTDAAMAAPFIDRVMGELEVLLAADAALVWAGGFRYASYIEDPRPLGLLMEDAGYRVFRLMLDCGDAGARRGAVLLALPAEGRGRMPPCRDAAGLPADAPVGADPAGWTRRMTAAVLGAAVELDAVLDRVALPLSAVLALRPGATVVVRPGAVGRVTLEGYGRRFVAQGRLGQCQGAVAVRLNGSPEEAAEVGEPDGGAGAGAPEVRAIPGGVRQAGAVSGQGTDERPASGRSATG